MAAEPVAAPKLELTPRQRWTLTAVATATMAISYVDRQALMVLAPQVTDALHLTETEYGYLASAFSVAYLVGTPLGGLWIDRAGVRRGLLSAVLGWTVIAALHAVVPGFRSLFALRLLLGLLEAPAFPGAAQTVTRVLPPGERARGTGVLFTGSSIGAMVVPPLAAYLSREYSWQVAFLGTALAGLLWVPLWLWSTRDEAVKQVLAPPPAHEVQPQVGFATLLSLPVVRRAMAVVLASAPMAAFVLLWGAKYLVRAQHVEKVDAGNYLWLPPVLYDLASVGFGDQATRKRPLRLLVGLAGCLCAMGGVTPWMSTPWQGALGLALAHAGVGGLFALVTSEALSGVPSVAVARTGGMLAATQSLAYIVTNLLIASSVEATHSFDRSALALSAWVLPGVLYWVISKR